jgi:hypothetical protein
LKNFFNSLSPFTVLVYQVPCGRLVFSSLFFPLCATGLRGTFPGHPRPPSLLLFSFLDNTTRNTAKHPWEAHPAWDLNPAGPRGGVGRVSLFLPPPYRQPLKDIHTHPWPGGGFFLGKIPPPSVRFEPTSAGTATSEHCLRQPCGHRATKLNKIKIKLNNFCFNFK